MSTAITSSLTLNEDDTTCTTTSNGQEAPTSDNNNLGVLNWNQVKKLDSLLNKPIDIHGRGSYPTLTVRLKDFIRNLNKRLVEQRVRVRDVRINGGVASYVLARQDDYEFSDIDIIFSCDLLQLNDATTASSSSSLSELSPEAAFSNCCDIIKQTVFECLLDYFPACKDKIINPQIFKDAYVKKMVKIYQQSSQKEASSTNLAETDFESAESMQSSSRWSLISLCNNQGQNIELKFVDKMKRQFQFSVDAFQIHLASLLKYYDLSSNDECSDVPQTMNENIYPTVVAESMYGDFDEANHHLNEKLIATKSPEEIRGGGLLKYCNLLVRGYKPVNGGESQMNTMEKYMCSRFFIDFSDLADQEHKLNAYLDCHFQNAPHMCVFYLKKLYEVVNSSTVCLMGHERKQTLNLIDSLAKQYQQQHQPQQQSDDLNDQFDNDSESVNSDSSSLSSSSSSLSHQQQQQLQQQQKNNNYYHHHHHHYHQHHHHQQPQRTHRNNRLYYRTPNSSSTASSPSSSSSILYDSTNTTNYSRSSPSTDLNYSNQFYYLNYPKYRQHQVPPHHQQQQQQYMSHAMVVNTSSNKLAIPFSSSSSLSSSSSSVVSSPSPSPPLTATPTTVNSTAASASTPPANIPFYITISTPTPQEQENDTEENDENTTPNDNSNASIKTSTTPTSVFQCKIPTQYYPLIEVFNYFSPPVVTTAASCTISSNASSPVYFYTDPASSPQHHHHHNQESSNSNIITRILPSKSYQFCCSPTYEYNNYVSSIQHYHQQQQQQQQESNQTERADLAVQ